MAESQYSWEVPEGAKSSYDRWIDGEGISVVKILFVEDIRKDHIEKYQPSLDRKKGGSQIECADEEQIIRDWSNEAMVKGGVPSQMAKQYEKKQ